MTWSLPAEETPVIYLTFDDGPIPEITPWVLDTLKAYKAKATFFCVGENAVTQGEILNRIKNEGHAIGNHTHNHLNGWKTKDRDYFKNIITAREVLETTLFRPPYGRMKPSQLKVLRKQYKIVMWSILTHDYDQRIAPEQCLENALMAKNGDIVLFHDNIKAKQNLEFALPKFLEHYSQLGFEFRVVN